MGGLRYLFNFRLYCSFFSFLNVMFTRLLVYFLRSPGSFLSSILDRLFPLSLICTLCILSALSLQFGNGVRVS